jgi:hypothetical protein
MMLAETESEGPPGTAQWAVDAGLNAGKVF